MGAFKTIGGLVVVAGALGSASLAHAATATYNLATDFSIASNPNGVWSYGYETTLGGPLILYNTPSTSNGIRYWNSSTVNVTGDPTVFFNPTNAPITVGTYTVPAGLAAFHPGSLDEYSVYRFTAPTTGLYTLTSSYGTIDRNRGVTDLHVLLNNLPIFASCLGNAPPTCPQSAQFNPAPLALTAGAIVDFAIGFGQPQATNNYLFDSTAIIAQFTTPIAVPGPIAGAGLPALFGLAGAWFVRRRKQTLAA
jgi:hypothetical protein